MVAAEHDFGCPALFAEFDREQRSYTGQVFVSVLGGGRTFDLDETLAGFGERTNLRDAKELRAFRDSLLAGFQARRLDRVFGDLRQLFLAAQKQHAAVELDLDQIWSLVDDLIAAHGQWLPAYT